MGHRIDSKLQKLSDHRDILDCLTRYCRGLDRHDWDLILSAFHPDAIEKHGGLFYGPAPEFVEWLRQRCDGHLNDQHAMSNHHVDIDGDIAHVESYAQSGRPDGDKIVVTAGRYVTRLERRQGIWKIAAREAIIEWTGSMTKVWADADDTDLAVSKVDRTDRSYLRPFTLG